MSEQTSSATSHGDPVAQANLFLSETGEGSYADWVTEDLKAMMAAYRSFRQSQDVAAARNLSMSFQALQDMGSTFGYPLVSEIGLLAVRFLESGLPKDARDMDVLHVLTESMELVLAKKLSGDGGAVGQALLMGIHAALHKVGKD
ncbi:MAG: hypothetical protein HQL44_01895 [Alphaproteobacteria bacterium]|nr:hypothetical protein [Alphaproteobacteria bacterium]